MTMMMRTRKRTKTRSGKVIPAILLVGVLTSSAFASGKANKPDKRTNHPAPYALIAGTVYRPPGFAVPRAEVHISAETPSAESSKIKPEKLITNNRGEFSLRVPPVPMRYRVRVQVNGYQAQEKSVSIEGEQRQDLSFLLDPAKAEGELK